jgi:aromatase
MPRTTRSVFIKGTPDQVFEIINDIPRWTELYTNMAAAKVISFERHGRFAKLTFELTNKEGHTWRAWRILDYQDRMVMSRRGSPSFPYVFHHLTWTCEPAEENGVAGTLMTWTDDFEMDRQSPIKNEGAEVPMLAHVTEAQENFKRVIENYLAASV